MYGAAHFRLRERDFESVMHVDGESPEWPLKYDVFEPYYRKAEEWYHVHGLRGEDPTEPPASSAYPYAPISHDRACRNWWMTCAQLGSILFTHPRESPWTKPIPRSVRVCAATAAMDFLVWCKPRVMQR